MVNSWNRENLSETDLHGKYALLAKKLAALMRSAKSRSARAWLSSRKSTCEEKAGQMLPAIQDISRAIRMDPSSAEYHAQRGHLLFYRKRYLKAASDFSRAIQLSPEKPGIYFQRAQAYWLAGEAKKAHADLRRSAAFSGTSVEIQFRKALFEILTGHKNSARLLIRRWKRSREDSQRACAAFLSGAGNFREKDFAGAHRFFAQAEALSGDSGFPARFYRLAPTVLSSSFRFLRKGFSMKSRHKNGHSSKNTGRVVIAGLGLDYPRQASLEVLEELSRCDTVFSNLAGAEAMYFLSLFNSNIRTVSYEGFGGERKIAQRILAEAQRGRRVIFITRGHPLISGHLAQVILDLARRRGVPVVSYGSVSTIDTVLAISQSNLYHVYPGVQIYDARLLTSKKIKLQRGLPVLLSLGLKSTGPRDLFLRMPKWIHSLSLEISRCYSSKHRAFLYGPRYDARQMEAVAVGELESRLLKIPSSMISSIMIYLPPEGVVLQGFG